MEKCPKCNYVELPDDVFIFQHDTWKSLFDRLVPTVNAILLYLREKEKKDGNV